MNYLLSCLAAQQQTLLHVELSVNRGIERGVARVQRHGSKGGCIVGEERAQHRGGGARGTRVTGGKSRMLRQTEHRRNSGIGLGRTQFQIGELGVPAPEGSVVLRYRLQGVDARRAGSIAVQVILEDREMHRVQPRIDERRLPKPGRVIGGVSASEILDDGDLSLKLGRVRGGRSG